MYQRDLVSSQGIQPPATNWVIDGFETLRNKDEFRLDRFEATMKHSAVDARTGGSTEMPPANIPLPSYINLPQVRYLDCNGKILSLDSDESVDVITIHLMSASHKQFQQNNREAEWWEGFPQDPDQALGDFQRRIAQDAKK